MEKPRVLIVSNGAGEDSIAAQIIRCLHKVDCEALPLVGEGASYGEGLELIGPRRVMPSGGLVPENYWRLGRDICGGMLAVIGQQLTAMWRRRRRYRMVVAVGDLWAVAMALLSGIRPVLFVGTAKSAYHHDYSALEALVLRLFRVRSLVRDEVTAASLRRRGVRAAWVGNAIMDGLQLVGCDLGLRPSEAGLVMFPGSREGTYSALPPMLAAYQRLLDRARAGGEVLPRALVVLAPSIDMERLAQVCNGYLCQPTGTKNGVVAQLRRGGDDDFPVQLLRGAMADALVASRLAFGLAGTAHEQAAGFGLAVVACDRPADPSAPLGWYRGRQQGLLGEALSVVTPDESAVDAVLWRLWSDEAEREFRGSVGRKRMGPAGGAAGMAAVIERMAEGAVLEAADMAALAQQHSILAENGDADVEQK